MTCPCNNPCPDDEPITPVTPLEPTDCQCWCSPCWCSTRRDNPWINIQSTNECLSVDTSECGVVKLTSHCPPVVEAWDNITVDVSEEDGHTVYTVNAECEDKRVKVQECGSAWYLADKIVAWWGIDISNSCNTMEISVDWDDMPDPQLNIPEITVDTSASKYINATVWWPEGHDIIITDKWANAYYAKLTLNQSQLFQAAGWQEGVQAWYIQWFVSPSWEFGAPSFNKNLTVDAASGIITVTKDWLYNIWFTGNVEINYWIHAFRIQMYRVAPWSVKTVLESRYSWPLWAEPFTDAWLKAWYFKYVSSVTWGGWESVPSVSYDEIKIDYPLISDYTETERQEWKSQSLWIAVDRIPVCWNTIIELAAWDSIIMWVKLSTSIRSDWILHAYEWKAWHLHVLWLNSPDWDNWWENWFHFYVDLIHPLNKN